ncbi:MAG: hypothetical protein P8O91_03560 [Luminiphilus sp.]|nr:hypothetical protein [Luminiphilus sp.]
MTKNSIFLGNSPLKAAHSDVSGDYVKRHGESFYRIENFDAMSDFFISVVSDSNHWLYISTRGGLTAGRTDCDSALFPYYTEDKIRDNSSHTGSRTILLVKGEARTSLWEPFARQHDGIYSVSRNLYKNVLGDKLVFEEINHDLGLAFTYSWSTTDKYGFVKQSMLANTSNKPVAVDVLDGIENLLPYGVLAGTQNELSCLVDAYKKNELIDDAGLGIYAMSSILSDRAEPSEALCATTVWSYGLTDASVLLSSVQLDDFRRGLAVEQELEVLGRRGAYFVNAIINLAAKENQSWGIVADVNQGPAAVRNRLGILRSESSGFIESCINDDIALGSQHLERLISTADGIQLSADTLTTNHHASNVLFNIMRGGLFDDNYTIDRDDLWAFCRSWNASVTRNNSEFFEKLPDTLSHHDLDQCLERSQDLQLKRLCVEYLPMTFSRRHGDPSRPWNRFAIKVKDENDAKILNYEGNWRDIFQNWEALSTSIPCFAQNMIAKFVNASTADGYNPYRITRDGIDWERPEPENPWANIGYWGDHQLIYLLKLIELSRDHNPSGMTAMLTDETFAYANVPYRIKPYADILADPYDTIVFDDALDRIIDERVQDMGADGRLMLDGNNAVYQVNLTEKLLVTLLTKVSNFIPDVGVWMNTQRPEWNDANNALVGNGVSVVTLCYLHRFLKRAIALLATIESDQVMLSCSVAQLLDDLHQVLLQHKAAITSGPVSPKVREAVMAGLGSAAELYREGLYAKGFSGEKQWVSLASISNFLELSLESSAVSIASNRREDGLFHAYNRISWSDSGVEVRYLYEMLEGQVAVLSAEVLSAQDALHVLSTLRKSSLYTARQHSYLLYPNRQLPAFINRNCIPEEFLKQSPLMTQLVDLGNTRLVEADHLGAAYFSGRFNNTASVAEALNELAVSGFAAEVAAERQSIEGLFSTLFDCDNFTGRSGGMYAFEGLGSIYWHMVSKLLLAVMETVQAAEASDCSDEILSDLKAAYYDVRDGIGFNKTPEVYGAFPTDPYSHTPGFAGARQPGMTGQVKEEVLTRLAELGVNVANGCVSFIPSTLRRRELLTESAALHYFDIAGKRQSLMLSPGQIGFTYCQVPVVYSQSDGAGDIRLTLSDGRSQTIEGKTLSSEVSTELFKKRGAVTRIDVAIMTTLD